MNNFKRIFSFLLLSVIVLTSFSITVFAGSNWDGLTEKEQTNARNLYAYLKLQGYSDYAAAGICGNADAESSFSDDFNSGDRTYYGYFQVNEPKYGVWTTLKNWCSSAGLDYTDIVVQFKYVETVLEGDFKRYTDTTLADYKNCSDIITGTEGFMVAFERCVNGDYVTQKINVGKSAKYQGGQQRIDYATNLYTALVGTEPSDSSGSSSSSNGTSTSQADTISALMSTGYYTEEQLSSYIKLSEMNISEKYLVSAMRDDLSQSDLSGLVNWERNIKNSKEESGFIYILRLCVMWIGIFFIIWVILVYIAYWFDRINTLFYIDLLSLLTFGKLHISDTEQECTFHLNTMGKTDKKTVNHKAILFICITGILFGTLIVSGAFYTVIAKFVNWVLTILS